MAVVGIDLGTTKSVVAILRGQRPEVLPNREGDRLTPSVVGLGRNGDVQIGKRPKESRLLLKEGPIEEIKRLMGTSERVMFEGRERSPQEISALILSHLKDDAERFLGEPVQAAVITIPAYFNEPERRATREAGELAGLHVGAVLDEPTAAAIAYGVGRDMEETILVYDLGGGTFDVSILSVAESHFEVLGISGNKRLGGKDFDRRIMAWLFESIQREYGIDASSDRRATHRLTLAAENAKKELSNVLQTSVLVEALTSEIDVDLAFGRHQLEELIRPLVASTVPCIEEALARAELGRKEIDRVVLIGGSTRIPLVQKTVAEYFGKEPMRDINPDEAVALGAAVFTHSLDPKELAAGVARISPGQVPRIEITTEIPAAQVVPRIPHPLGIGVSGNRLAVILEANSFYPIEVQKKDFFIGNDSQQVLEIPVFEGENPIASENTALGEIEMNLPAGLKAGTRVWVTFKYNASRILEVTVEVPEAGGRRATAQLKSGADLDPAEKERIRGELRSKRGAGGKEMAEEVLQRACRVYELNQAKLSPERRQTLEQKIRALEEALKSGYPDLLTARMVELGEMLEQIHRSFEL